jgi:hypothetical protein
MGSVGVFAESWKELFVRGLVPVPVVPAGKRPLVTWGRWQHHPPTARELEGLARKFSGADVAVLLSAPPPFRSLLDVDCDAGTLPSWLEGSGSAFFTSPRGGHLLFERPKDTDLRYLRLLEFEIRTNGIVVVPPSFGRSWIRPLEQLGPPPPELLRLLIRTPSQQPSSPQIREAEPKAAIQFFRADGPWWPQIAEFLGLQPRLYTNIRCPVHPPDEHPSGWLVVDRKGLVVFLCFHQCFRQQQVYTLPEIYARQRLRGPSLATWSLRLAHDAGALKVHVPPPPPLQNQAAAKVLAGFLELWVLRSWPEEPSPTDLLPFTPRFAASWCSVSELQAKRALDFLCHQLWLSVERGVRFRLYRPGLRLLQHLRVLEGCA